MSFGAVVLQESKLVWSHPTNKRSCILLSSFMWTWSMVR